MEKKTKQIIEKTADVSSRTVGGVVKTVVKVFFSCLLVILTTGLLFGCIFAYYVKTTLSSNLEIRLEDFSVSLSSTIYYKDSSGNYQTLETLSRSQNRIWVEYGQIPENMKNAIIAIEDQRFNTHKGVDWYRTTAAFAQMFVAMRNDFGGSTITQQVIKNVTDNDASTVERKLLEIFQALELEKNYDKSDILEWYLNYVYFGQGCYGISTAADTYFGKDVQNLTLAECACIAGITNLPTKYDPFINEESNKERQEIILYEMYDQGYISYEEYTQAKNEKLQFARGEDEVYSQKIYSYYVETVIDDVVKDLMAAKGINEDAAKTLVYSGGYEIYCSLDMDIQNIVDSVYEDVENLPQPYYKSDQQLQSAIVIMNPYTGEIVALSGGVGEKTESFVLNRINSKRSCGSSIKPLASYGPALEYGYITQTTLVNDSPDITLSGTSWYPKNADWKNYYIVDIKTALQKSLNTVAAQIVDKLTPEVCYDYLTKKLGFTTLVSDDNAYAPMSLGEFTYGVTVREMTQAYASFVNNGIFTESRTYTMVKDSKGNIVLDNQPKTHIAWKENTAANICSLLQNAATVGTGSGANFYTTAVAGKTGSGTNNYNRYFAGFTAYYTACVWTGYDMNEEMYFYTNPAVTIWKQIMEQVHEGLEYKSFPTPVIGGPTGLFGTLDDLEEQNKKEEEPVEDDKKDDEDDDEPSSSPKTSPSPSPDNTSQSPSNSPDTQSSPPSTQAPDPSSPVDDIFAG